MLKRIALYGGTFDPVHNGHLAVARGVRRCFAIDEIWLIPAYIAPHKRQTQISSAWHRYAMLALATATDADLRISSRELDAPAQPYTIETLTRLTAELKNEARLFFVMGLDSWLDIKTWRDWEQVLMICDHIVVARPGYDWQDTHVTPEIRARIVNLWGLSPEHIAARVEGSDMPRIYATDAISWDISATEIRQATHDGKAETLRSLVAPEVAAYIEKYRLYR